MTAQENLYIWNQIQDKCERVSTDVESFYDFAIGDSFVIRISVPLNSTKQLFEHDVVSVRISQLHKDNSETSDLEVENQKVHIQWYVIPSSVHPQRDERFLPKDWSNQFVEKDAPIISFSVAEVSPDTACDIIRHCHSLSNLKSFW
jgi:hypothetical protein